MMICENLGIQLSQDLFSTLLYYFIDEDKCPHIIHHCILLFSVDLEKVKSDFVNYLDQVQDGF